MQNSLKKYVLYTDTFDICWIRKVNYVLVKIIVNEIFSMLYITWDHYYFPFIQGGPERPKWCELLITFYLRDIFLIFFFLNTLNLWRIFLDYLLKMISRKWWPYSASHKCALSNTFSMTFRKSSGGMLLISSRILVFNSSIVLGLLT